MQKIALVTGANRGIGLEVARQLAEKGMHVILTSRDATKGEEAAKKLKGSVEHQQLDVTDEKSIKRVAEYVEKKFRRLDVLVNNAGIFPDPMSGPESSVFSVHLFTMKRAIDTNTFGPLLMIQAFVSLMKKNGYGRIVNISTGMGQLSEMEGGYPAYRVSKTALNAVTRIFSAELAGTNVLVNSMCPGWVRTDMGGPHAERPVEKGAETAIWLATLPDGGPTGKFFRDQEEIAW